MVTVRNDGNGRLAAGGLEAASNVGRTKALVQITPEGAPPEETSAIAAGAFAVVRPDADGQLAPGVGPLLLVALAALATLVRRGHR